MSDILFTTTYTSLREKYKDLLKTVFTPTAWEKDKEYSYNTLVKPTTPNGSYYRCVQSGVSGHIEPEQWNTGFSSETVDSTVKWKQEEPVFILDTEPADFSYPCIVVRDVTPISEIQRATGNQPASELMTYLLIISYQYDNKTYNQTRLQCYDILSQVQGVIRDYPTLNGFSGVLRSVGGLFTIPEALPVMYRLQQSWITRLLVKREA